MSIRIVVGEDLKRLAMLRHQTAADVAYALADLLGGHDPQIAIRQPSTSTEEPGV
jgi:hypothetical protein